MERMNSQSAITFMKNTTTMATAKATATAEQQQQQQQDDDDEVPLMLSSSDYTSSTTTTAAVVAAATTIAAASSRRPYNHRNEKGDREQQQQDEDPMYHPYNNKRNAISSNAALSTTTTTTALHMWNNLSFKEKEEFISNCSLQDIGFLCCKEDDDDDDDDDTTTTTRQNATNIAVAKRLMIRGIPVDQIGVRSLRKFVSANDIKMKTKRNRLELTNAIAQRAIVSKEEEEGKGKKGAMMQSCKRAKTRHNHVVYNTKNNNNNNNHHNVVVPSGGRQNFLDGSSNSMIPFNHEIVLDAIQCYKRDNAYTILDRLLQEIMELEDEISDLEVCMDQFLKRRGNADCANTTTATTTTEERLEMMKLERKLKTWRERLDLKKSHKEQLQGDLPI